MNDVWARAQFYARNEKWISGSPQGKGKVDSAALAALLRQTLPMSSQLTREGKPPRSILN
jgi:hypothetical protein